MKRGQKEYAFRSLLKCGECGCSITSETHKGHNYYRCTKKKGKCSQKYIREELLAEQISNIIQKVSLPSAWTKKMIEELDKEKEQADQAEETFAQNLQKQIAKLDEKWINFWTFNYRALFPPKNIPSKNKKFSIKKLRFPKN